MSSFNPHAYGAPRVTADYACALHDAGHQVRFVYQAEIQPESHTILPRLRQHGIETIRLSDLASAYLPWACRTFRSMANDSDLLINTQRRDMVSTAMVSKQLRVPSLICVHNQPNFQGNGISRRLKRMLFQRNVSTNATRVMCVSQGVADILIGQFAVPPEKVTVIANGLDVNVIAPATGTEAAEVRAEFAIPSHERLVVNLGRLDRQKGHDVLLHAIAAAGNSLPPARFLLAGSPAPGGEAWSEHLHQLSQQRGVAHKVIWMGFRNDGHRLLRAADLFVLPSRWEGLPIAVLEAFATMTPTLMTEYGRRFPSFDDGVHGWYVEKENPEKLALKLVEVLQMNSAALQTIGFAGHQYLRENLTLRRSSQNFVAEVVRTISEARSATAYRR